MIIESITLENFLTYKKFNSTFENGINVLVGENAVGKTNLLDSIYFAALCRSSRGIKDKELINWETDKELKYARIRLKTKSKGISHTIDLSIDPYGKKRVLIDSNSITRIADLLGAIGIVFFSPTEMRLVKESPVDRRRFMDIALSQQDRKYYRDLVDYNKLLAQRNKVLKDYSASREIDSLSEMITDQMSEKQEYILKKRYEFISKIEPIAKEKHLYLTSGKEVLGLKYETEDIDMQNIVAELKKKYKESLQKDKKLQYTTVGIHRDDILIRVNDIDIRKFGSQGQQRSAVLSLKIAEIERYKNVLGETPVVLLDDVLSELDETRREALIKLVEGCQTFLTCTDFEKKDNVNIYRVTKGEIKRV